jgi:two-component system response regulator AtoC
LATHFTMKYARPGEQNKPISPAAMEVLLRHSWPGNIRELENAIERACVTSRDQAIQVENLPPDLTNRPAAASPFSIDLSKTLSEHLNEAIAQIEIEYIGKALERTQGHIGRCAQICGLSRRSITAKMAEYHLDKSTFKLDMRLAGVRG